MRRHLLTTETAAATEDEAVGHQRAAPEQLTAEQQMLLEHLSVQLATAETRNDTLQQELAAERAGRLQAEQRVEMLQQDLSHSENAVQDYQRRIEVARRFVSKAQPYFAVRNETKLLLSCGAPEVIELGDSPIIVSAPVLPDRKYLLNLKFRKGGLPKDETDAIMAFRFFDNAGKPVEYSHPNVRHCAEIGAYRYLDPEKISSNGLLGIEFKAPSGARRLELGLQRWCGQSAVVICNPLELINQSKRELLPAMEAAVRAVDVKRAAVIESDAVLRILVSLLETVTELEPACEAIVEIERLLGSEVMGPDATLLKELRRLPAYRLTALNLIEPKRPRVLDCVPTRICYVLSKSLPYSSDGYSARSHGLAMGLTQAGYEVVALTRPGFPIDLNPELRAKDVPPRDTIDAIPYVRTPEPLRRNVYERRYMRLAAAAIQARLEEFRPELVIAASNYTVALPALIAARRLGIPFVYEVRGFWEISRVSRDNSFEATPLFEVQRFLDAAVAREADQVFTLTESMRQELVGRGVPQEKIALLPNSCDTERLVPRCRNELLAERIGIPQGVPVIGYVGTFVAYEGLEDLTHACGTLKESGREFRLLVVGNENASGLDQGPITEQIVQIASERGFADWLIMPGRVPHEEVESYYSLIDICPFPRKPWPVCEMVSPLKPLEALAMQKAVLVSSVQALAELIQDGHTGLVFEKGSVDALASKLDQLLADPAGRLRLGEAGRAWVLKERTWRMTAERAARHIQQLFSHSLPAISQGHGTVDRSRLERG